jgi:FixJ family two-component response regulator
MIGNSHHSVRVAVISDEPQVAENVIHMLQSTGIASESFDTASDWMNHAQGGLESTKRTAMNGSGGDCVLLVGEVDSLLERSATAEIHDKHPGIPVVVVSTDVNVENAVAAMRQGAADVVPLPCPEERLHSAVQQASEAGRHYRQSLKRVQDLRERISSLTHPERQVLDAMMEGMANKQIAQQLRIGLRTVELRRSKIMRKMDAKSLAELVKLVCEADVPSQLPEAPSLATASSVGA